MGDSRPSPGRGAPDERLRRGVEAWHPAEHGDVEEAGAADGPRMDPSRVLLENPTEELLPQVHADVPTRRGRLGPEVESGLGAQLAGEVERA